MVRLTPPGRVRSRHPASAAPLERDVLLGFKADELFHIGIVQSRKLDEADENGLSGNGIVDDASFDVEFLDEVGDGFPYFRQAQAFC